MRSRSLGLAVLAVVAALLAGCGLVSGACKLTGLCAPPDFVDTGPMPPGFQLGVEVSDVADPPTDYKFVFWRSGQVSYDVLVRSPVRKHQSGNLEISDAQVNSLWKAVGDAHFKDLSERYPGSDNGKDLKNGVQKFYVLTGDAERRVESHFQSVPALEAIRKAAVAVVPKEVLMAAGTPGAPKEAPKEFVGDTKTHRFHRPECTLLKDIPTEQRQAFASPYDALNYNFEPCPECQPIPLKR
jgi:hypothetical protein